MNLNLWEKIGWITILYTKEFTKHKNDCKLTCLRPTIKKMLKTSRSDSFNGFLSCSGMAITDNDHIADNSTSTSLI